MRWSTSRSSEKLSHLLFFIENGPTEKRKEGRHEIIAIATWEPHQRDELLRKEWKMAGWYPKHQGSW